MRGAIAEVAGDRRADLARFWNECRQGIALRSPPLYGRVHDLRADGGGEKSLISRAVRLDDLLAGTNRYPRPIH